MRSAIVLRVWHFLLLLLLFIVAFYRAMVVAAAAVAVAVVDFHRIGSIRHLSLNTNCLLSVSCCLLLFLYTLYTHIICIPQSLCTRVCIPIRILLFSFVLWFSSLQMFFLRTVLCRLLFYDVCACAFSIYFMDLHTKKRSQSTKRFETWRMEILFYSLRVFFTKHSTCVSA